MKQSNSAITMLLSAFRSIYRNAYVKGIASAVVLTAGLAAGQAGATGLTFDDWVEAEGDIKVDSADTGADYHTVVISGSGTDVKIKGGLSITATAANASHNIQASGNALVFEANGDLSIAGSKSAMYL